MITLSLDYWQPSHRLGLAFEPNRAITEDMNLEAEMHIKLLLSLSPTRTRTGRLETNANVNYTNTKK